MHNTHTRARTWNCCPTVQGMRSPCGSSPRARLACAAFELIAPSSATCTTASTSGSAFWRRKGRGEGWFDRPYKHTHTHTRTHTRTPAHTHTHTQHTTVRIGFNSFQF